MILATVTDFTTLYHDIVVIVCFILAIAYALKWSPKNATQIIDGNRSNMRLLVIICLTVCILIGFRPIVHWGFDDMAVYEYNFKQLASGYVTVDKDKSEWLWDQLMKWVSMAGGDVSWFFFVVCLGYVFFVLWGLYRLFRNNTTGAMLFFAGAFSTYSYATNGIRNGLATSMIILALSFVVDKEKSHWIPAIAIAFVATLIHKSVLLPIVALGIAFFLRNIRVAILFWILSIFAYLLVGHTIEQFFTGLGFDDRLSGYIQNKMQYATEGFKTGFRIDFLIYSFMPILLGWYIVEKKKFVNNTYTLLLNTYIFSNAVWVMLMGAAYSNRFAYLSWFLYPIVMAYPCLRMNVWGSKQGKAAAWILFLNVAFTFFMHFVYY